VAVVLGPEEGEGGLDEVDLGEEDGLELVADEILGDGAGGELLDRADDSCESLASVQWAEIEHK
jgi:hypothetical protein